MSDSKWATIKVIEEYSEKSKGIKISMGKINVSVEADFDEDIFAKVCKVNP